MRRADCKLWFVVSWRRVQQGLRSLRPQPPNDQERAHVRRVLGEPLFTLFLSMPTYEQRHALCVLGNVLKAHGEADSALLAAAVLHDVGKVCGGARHATLDRVIVVLANDWQGTSYSMLSRMIPARVGRAMEISKNHPRLGARRVRAVGGSERLCWLIEHHQQENSWQDADLTALQFADAAC